MAVTEKRRHELFKWFEEQMGEERASTMIELMPPTGIAELATKHDLVVLKQDVSLLKQDVTTLKQDVTTLKQDVTTLKQDVTTLKQDVAALRQEMAEMETRITASLTRNFITWLLASQATVIAAVAGMLVVVS